MFFVSAGDGKGAVAAEVALAAVSAAEPAAEQLSMLPPTRFAEGDSRHEDLAEAVKRDQAGRPPGARNLNTRQTLAFIRSVMGDPALNRARWLRHTPATLAAELGCTKAEAFDRLDRINADLSRLFYAPMAPVDGDGNAVAPRFVMQIGGETAGGDGRKPWEYIDAEPQQNQALPASGPEVSPGEVSPK